MSVTLAVEVRLGIGSRRAKAGGRMDCYRSNASDYSSVDFRMVRGRRLGSLGLGTRLGEDVAPRCAGASPEAFQGCCRAEIGQRQRTVSPIAAFGHDAQGHGYLHNIP